MSGKFDGKVALVTGAGGGIGQATALAFSREGANVVVCDISEQGGKETVRSIKEQGGQAVFVQTDVRKFDDAKMMVAAAESSFGRLDLAHNNAGIDGEFVSIVQCSEENWDNVIATNLKSVWAAMKFEIPLMLKSGGGVIVNTGSTASLFGYRVMGHYVASKHGVAGLTKTAALECSKRNIRINCLCPGVIRTRMIDDYVKGVPEVEAAMIGMEPVERMGTPEEIANTVLWICSNEASFMTGAIVPIDGGISAQSGNYPPVPDF
jgi:NAD(P)-dependent dehydrogenase (short-subunit alcohol dehydrogenase family)